MMRSWRWRAAAILAPAATMAAMVTGATPASAATSPTWQLINEFAGTTVCNTTAGATDQLQVYLSGTWSTAITIGASNLPAGASYSFFDRIIDGYKFLESHSPTIPAGSSVGNGVEVLGPRHNEFLYVEVTLPAGLAPNSTVTVTLSATDGTTTQTEPVTIGIQNSCTALGN